VIETLEAALWSFLKGREYSSSILTAVNLGVDTDTIAA
jgi:ADP-ribosylglycohydrolase